MAITLQKKQGITLEKGLNNVKFSVEWDTNIDIDIHASVLKDGKAEVDEDLIFYGNTEHPTGAIKHSGDVRNGSLQTGIEDEYITVVLNKLQPNKNEVLFSASINNANLHGLHFGQAKDAKCKLINIDNEEVLAEYRMDLDLMGETSAKIARIFRDGSVWKFQALGQAMPSLESIIFEIGLEVE